MKELLLKIDLILKENESRQDLKLGCLLPDWAIMHLEGLKEEVRKLDSGGNCAAPPDHDDDEFNG